MAAAAKEGENEPVVAAMAARWEVSSSCCCCCCCLADEQESSEYNLGSLSVDEVKTARWAWREEGKTHTNQKGARWSDNQIVNESGCN